MKLEMTPQMAMYTLDNFNLRTNADNYDNCALDLAIEALKKQIPERPDFEGDGYDENGFIILDTWICPCCEEKYETDYDIYKHCPNCGQAIDWSEEE